MPGPNHNHPPLDQLEDLDLTALAYVHQYTAAPPDRQHQLRNDLVNHCLPFAGRLARRYRGRGEPIEDLEQVARLGLLKAIDRYNPERGSFTAFATVTMSGELKRHFRDTTWTVHVPRRLQDLNLDIRRATGDLTHRLLRSPTTGELAHHLATSEQAIHEARRSATCYAPTSLNTPIDHDSTTVLADVVASTDDAVHTLTDRLTVIQLLHRLPDRERGMLLMRFYGNHTQTEIADEYGVSQMHVSRLISHALTWLRDAMLSDTTPPWPHAHDHTHHLHTRTTHTATTLTLHLIGELDHDNTHRLHTHLQHAIHTADQRRINIDLTGVPLLDATAINTLWQATTNPQLHITNPRPHIAPLLTMFGITTTAAI
jgi:RNA polymerase sigma-B factor